MKSSIGRLLTLGLVIGSAAVAAGTSGTQGGRDADQPSIQRFRLSNGLPVWMVEHHDLPVVQVSLVVLRGTGDDPPGRFGIASLTSGMLLAGTDSRSASQIADAIDRLKGNLAPTSGVDHSSLQLQVPVEGLTDALSVMADVVQHPAFQPEMLERVRQDLLLTLKRSRDNPDAIAALAFSRSVYGPSHRYGTALIGTDDSISRFARADLVRFHEAAYRPDTSTLLVVGDVRPAEVMKPLEAHFGSWRQPKPLLGAPGNSGAPPAQSRRVVLVDLPGAPQSRMLAGGVGTPRASADFFSIQVMNAVFRDRLTVRLGENAAGIRSGFDLRKGPGPFVAAAAVRVDATAESLAGLNAVVGRMHERVPADELARAKAEVVVRLPTFESTGRITARLQSLESILVHGLPDDYDSIYSSAVERISASDVQRVAGQFLRPDRLAIVIVGDLAAIEPGIRALNPGPISRMTVDEAFAPAR
jgi:zinc protease